MKKKIFLLSIIAILLAFVLVGCTNDFKVSKKGHDSILYAADSTYIAVDGGKSYLYSIKNSRKLTKKGFDKLEYIDSLSDSNENYLLAYNAGDIGYSVVNKKGKQVIVSTTDMKISDAYIMQEITYDGETAVITDKFIDIEFSNYENRVKSAAFRLDGAAISYDKDSEVSVYYAEEADDKTMKLDYITSITRDNTGLVSRYEVFDSNLTSIYAQSFTETLLYTGHTAPVNGLSYIGYRKVADEGNINYLDVFAGGKAYIGYTNIEDTLNNEDGDTAAYIVSKYNTETNTVAYSLIGKAGVLKTFDEYTIFSNNIHIPEGENINVINYLGVNIVSNAKINGLNHYVVTVGETNMVYNMKGQKLFETATTTFINDNKEVYNGKVIEYFELVNSEAEMTYKFFQDGLLVKEYGPSYTLDTRFNDIYVFSTKNQQGVKDYIYNYSYASNIETVVAANIDGDMNVEIMGTAPIGGGKSAYYYVEKESKEIVFYSGLISKISPYQGDKVPSYSVVGGNYSFSRVNILFGDTAYSYLTLVYEALTKTEVPNSVPKEYTYESNGETLYAYYLIDGVELGSGLVELYSGHNMARIYASEDFELIMASTIDKFADEASVRRYSSFEHLADKTRVFKVSRNEETLKLSLSIISEFAKSNVVPATRKYLISKDYSNTRDDRHSVYKYDGNLILDSKYEVQSINGDLARVGIGSAWGVYNLKKEKLLEDVKHLNLIVHNDNLYSVGTIKENGILTTFKDANGKKIVSDCNSYEAIGITYDFNESQATEYFVVYLGKGKLKLMTVSYYDPRINKGRA